MTSGYITAALERAALPIGVSTGKDLHGYFLIVRDRRIRTCDPRDIINLWNAGWPHLTGDPADARRMYLRLVDYLQSNPAAVRPARPSPTESAGTAADANRSPASAALSSGAT